MQTSQQKQNRINRTTTATEEKEECAGLTSLANPLQVTIQLPFHLLFLAQLQEGSPTLHFFSLFCELSSSEIGSYVFSIFPAFHFNFYITLVSPYFSQNIFFSFFSSSSQKFQVFILGINQKPRVHWFSKIFPKYNHAKELLLRL